MGKRNWNTPTTSVSKKKKPDPRGGATVKEEKADTAVAKMSFILKTKKLRKQAQQRAVAVAKKDLSQMLDNDIMTATKQQTQADKEEKQFARTLRHAKNLHE